MFFVALTVERLKRASVRLLVAEGCQLAGNGFDGGA